MEGHQRKPHPDHFYCVSDPWCNVDADYLETYANAVVHPSLYSLTIGPNTNNLGNQLHISLLPMKTIIFKPIDAGKHLGALFVFDYKGENSPFECGKTGMQRYNIQKEDIEHVKLFRLKPEGKMVVQLQAKDEVHGIKNTNDAPLGLSLVHFKWTYASVYE